MLRVLHTVHNCGGEGAGHGRFFRRGGFTRPVHAKGGFIHHYVRHSDGFTLVEMMVAVSLFTIAAVIGLGALLVINDAYRKTKAQQVAIDNLNFALESMTRSIRTGFLYDCAGAVDPAPNSCAASPSPAFSYVDFSGRTVVYRLNDEAGRGSIQMCAFTAPAACTFVDLTAPDIDINNLRFYVIDAERVSGQPRVVISIQGIAGRRVKELTPFSVQTTVTARN